MGENESSNASSGASSSASPNAYEALAAKLAEVERALADERTRNKAFRAGQRQFFESMLSAQSLSATLNALVHAIEVAMQGALCSILLLDKDGKHLGSGVAPSLPEAYNKAIDGVEIGPMVGSCGTAAALNQTIIVTDIESDPRWAPFAPLALSHQLRACWSVPFHDGQGKVLGTFAFYYREKRAPTESELEWIHDSAHLAAVAVEQARTATALAENQERLRVCVSNAPLLFFGLDKDGVCTFVEGKAAGNTAIKTPEVGENLIERLDKFRPEIAADMHRCLSGEVIQVTREFGPQTAEGWYTPIYGKDGTITGMVVIVNDVTERKKAEHEAKALQEEMLRVQAEALAELSTPLIPIRDDVLVMPLIGTIDTRRAERVLQTLLAGIVGRSARYAILDITGVSVVDTQVADALINTAKAAELVGARVILTGIRPGVAQTLVELGVNLGHIVTRSTLQSGIAFAEGRGEKRKA